MKLHIFPYDEKMYFYFCPLPIFPVGFGFQILILVKAIFVIHTLQYSIVFFQSTRNERYLQNNLNPEFYLKN